MWKKCRRLFCSKKALREKFPIIEWLPKYSLRDLQCDIISGLTVALTVLPQGLAYAKVANLPAQYGLYSAFLGCFVYTIFGTSKDITLGPTAIMSLVTAEFAHSPVHEDPTYAIVLTLTSGAFMFILGLLRLGIVVSFFSFPVISAFTSAAAITIAFGQVKGVLGLKGIPIEFKEMVYETFKHVPDTNVWDLIMGLACCLVLFLLRLLRGIRWKNDPNKVVTWRQLVFRKFVWLLGIGGNAIVVILSSGIAAIMIHNGLPDKLSITGYIPPGLPPFRAPSFSLEVGNTTRSGGEIIGDIGAGIAIVPILAMVEMIAIGKAFARQNHYKISPNQELIAAGLANVFSSFVSAYPITGSFSRTAVNSQSGVRTPASGLVTGATVLIALQVMTPAFYYIPKAALSGVIIMAVLPMIEYHVLIKLWKTQRVDLVPLVATFVACLALGLEYGIGIGLLISILMVLYPMARPRVSKSGTDPVILKLNLGMRFPSIEFLQHKISSAMHHEGWTRSVILDCSSVTAMDSTTMQGLSEIVVEFSNYGAVFVIACLKESLVRSVERCEIRNLLLAPTVDDAIQMIADKKKEDELSIKLEEETEVDSDPVPNGGPVYHVDTMPNGDIIFHPEVPPSSSGVSESTSHVGGENESQSHVNLAYVSESLVRDVHTPSLSRPNSRGVLRRQGSRTSALSHTLAHTPVIHSHPEPPPVHPETGFSMIPNSASSGLIVGVPVYNPETHTTGILIQAPLPLQTVNSSSMLNQQTAPHAPNAMPVFYPLTSSPSFSLSPQDDSSVLASGFPAGRPRSTTNDANSHTTTSATENQAPQPEETVDSPADYDDYHHQEGIDSSNRASSSHAADSAATSEQQQDRQFTAGNDTPSGEASLDDVHITTTQTSADH